MRRDYASWNPSDKLDPEAEAVLAFLERLATHGRLSSVGEVVASVDEYGVVRADVPVGGNCALFVQAGDGWDRVLWTTRSGRVHEWTWSPTETPDDVRALLDGHGVERTTLFGRRPVEVALIVRDRVVATSGGWWRPLVRRVVRLSERVEPAL
jgi:hypothetical protein